ncbi:phage major capsid protein [Pseudomonas turukhanskensis]|uniref:Phage capsid protein n=1 Tax=Pseudomonas turukhanskensis TaxID=1806536 RepID=A0A9W6K988_9PSED|nr:phage major capsid protein [Pseudomonas turukhanskensis]GLK90035.1 phage capsid protein [Pseudomonas turukhanskensis]
MSIELLTKAVEEQTAAVVEMKTKNEAEIAEQKSEIRRLNDFVSDLAQKYVRGNHSDSFETFRTPGDLSLKFSQSDQFAAVQNGAPTTGRVALDGVSIKALTNAGAGVTGSTDYNVQAQRADGLYNDPRRSLTLLDILPRLPVSVGSFEYMRLIDYVNAAAFQTEEGQQKAEATLEMEPETATIATIAHFTRASVQVLDDAPALAQKIGDLLQYGLLAKLEAELVSGTEGKGRIKGLVDFAIPFAVTGTPAPVDAIGQAVVGMNSNGWEAGLIVMNPVDWFTISSERGTDGQYVLGSPRDPSPPALWGVPVVTTPSLAVGSVLVVDPNQVAILDREQPSLMASRESGNNFTTNMVTLLAETRAGLAVFSAGAVLVVDLTPA